MTNSTEMETALSQYSRWCGDLRNAVEELAMFLRQNKVTDLPTDHQFDLTLDILADESLSIAFIAASSKGKSEIINALFFSHYQHRILRCGEDQTTMCPCEFLYDEDTPVGIRLLPIESRLEHLPVFQLKQDNAQWVEIEFDPDDPDKLAMAVSSITERKLVSTSYAHKLGFKMRTGNKFDSGLVVNQYDEVEIPVWRYALVNIPHPLLKQGLVILDTPGLDAVGTEPDLTQNQLANAQVLAFVASQDSELTAGETNLWRSQFSQANEQGQPENMIIINKIDTVWDDLDDEEQIKQTIDQKINRVADLLKLDKSSIFPVSAQKGLQGKFSNDAMMVEKSRLPKLEQAISQKILQKKQTIISQKVEQTLSEILDASKTILNNRLLDTDSQISELEQISSRNTDVIAHIMSKVDNEKSLLESDMQRFHALRSVYAKEIGQLTSTFGNKRLELEIQTSREQLSNCHSSTKSQSVVASFIEQIYQILDRANRQADEIARLSDSIAEEFDQGHGIANYQVRRPRFDKYMNEVVSIEQEFQSHVETKSLFFRDQSHVIHRFFESACATIQGIFRRALKEINTWNNNLTLPLELHVREHHNLLRRRFESVKRIYKESDTVDARLRELEANQNTLQQLNQDFSNFLNNLNISLKKSAEEPG